MWSCVWVESLTIQSTVPIFALFLELCSMSSSFLISLRINFKAMKKNLEKNKFQKWNSTLDSVHQNATSNLCCFNSISSQRKKTTLSSMEWKKEIKHHLPLDHNSGFFSHWKGKKKKKIAMFRSISSFFFLLLQLLTLEILKRSWGIHCSERSFSRKMKFKNRTKIKIK